MATTTNFGWQTPDDTDLVKDGAAAIRTLGSSIDTSLVDLKGGTTGQVLSKNTNTDMDFTWVTTDDANAIQNAIVDAKGDLIAASAADTPARLAVGNDGDTLLADSSQTTGLRWGNNLGFTAGKNKIINGDFNIWQRGTSFSNPANNSYLADRWTMYNGGTPTTYSYSRQAFTAGAAPVAGYEGTYFMRSTITTVGSNTAFLIFQKIEDVRTLAGQTVTISFWAKADSTRSVAVAINQDFGSGGSSEVGLSAGTASVTTSWQRFTYTVSLASISGKTIGTNSSLNLVFTPPSASGMTFDLWGVQVEAGSVATAFQTATGTLAGELALAMRYFYRIGSASPNSAFSYYGIGFAPDTTNIITAIPLKVVMRTAPSMSYLAAGEYNHYGFTPTTIGTDTSANHTITVITTSTSLTTRGAYPLYADSTNSSYIDISAELQRKL